MAGFDTNALMPTSLPQQTNPLEFASQAIGVRNALLGNKIRQAEFDARNALGSAYANHFNALTGKYDIPALQSELGSTAAGRLALPEAVTTLGSQKTQQIGNEAHALMLKQAKMGAYASMLDDVKTPEQLEAAGRVATDYFGESPKEVGQLKQFIMSHPGGVQGGALAIKTAMLPAQGQLDTQYGSNASLSNGAGTYTGTRASAAHGGAFTPNQYTHNSPSEAQLLSPVTIKDPESGKDVSMPLGEYLHRQGVTLQSAPIQDVTHSGSLPDGAENYPWNSGRYEGAPTADGSQNAPSAPGMVSGLSPGQASAADAAGHSAGLQYAEAGQRAAAFAANTYQAKKALHGLEQLGTFSQGRAGEFRNAILNAAQSLGFPVDPQKTATYDETNKYLVQMAMNQPGAAHSDQQLAASFTANPSLHINNLSAQDVLKSNIALARRANAAHQAFSQQYPGTSAQTHADEWPQFLANYTQKRDIRPYVWDLLDNTQRARMWSGMDAKQKAAFAAQVQEAHVADGDN
ncbi:hypothetical protein [Gluconobacter albidus]|uniref:hypothetical protein n=1 Tax=Gluconobacter albidus TaxID=318683 RepID=UPI001B8B7889|nr:hypothetical protein [Gluconobacter albidus]MBS1028314.1 hypothetical protein [Gluconobacter albidus]